MAMRASAISPASETPIPPSTTERWNSASMNWVTAKPAHSMTSELAAETSTLPQRKERRRPSGCADAGTSSGSGRSGSISISGVSGRRKAVGRRGLVI
jgi:hypothetical protein